VRKVKKLILNYIKMLKAGFFYKTFLYSLLLIIPSVVKALSTVRSDFYEIFFVVIVGFLIVSLGMNEISEKRYIFCVTLPMRIKDVIKITYLHTYVIYILGFIGTLSISICSHQELPMLYLLFIVLFLLCTNYLYPCLASSELRIRTDQQSDTGIWTSLAFVGMVFIALSSFIGAKVVGPNTIFNCELLGIVIISSMAAFTLKKSYKATLKKVMGV
jgi:hypothetical protein